MGTEIIIVSGLPRSGTSLMMQMLADGGIEVVTDHVRTADADNPRGYFEYEMVKKVREDASWLPATRGKAFKMVSQLLYHLPATESYRILFMERDLDEVLASQEKMLARLGRPAAPRGDIKRAFLIHLERLREWLAQQTNMAVLHVSYNELVERPEAHLERVAAFVGADLDLERMTRCIEPALYRNRKAGSELLPGSSDSPEVNKEPENRPPHATE
jgi:hypothetical protein